MIKPLNEFIVVKVDTTKVETEKDGFIVPDTAKKKPYIGTVIASSEEVEHKVKEGDIVVWPSTLGVEITIEEEELVVLKLEDILLKLSK